MSLADRGSRGAGVLRGALWTASAFLLALLASLLVVPTAQANATGCTPVGGWRVKGMSPNNVCILIKGHGLHVDRAEVNMGAPAGGLQNVVLRITFFDAGNHQVEQFKSQLHKGTRTKEEFRVYPNKDYPNGRVCGSLTENGVERPGACVGIHA